MLSHTIVYWGQRPGNKAGGGGGGGEYNFYTRVVQFEKKKPSHFNIMPF